MFFNNFTPAYKYEAHPWVMNQKSTADELKNALLADLSEINVSCSCYLNALLADLSKINVSWNFTDHIMCPIVVHPIQLSFSFSCLYLLS